MSTCVRIQDTNTSGNFFIDEELLRSKLGFKDSDFTKYAISPGMPLMPDAYVGDVDTFLKWAKAGEMMNAIGSLFSSKKK